MSIRISIVSFTRKGGELAETISRILRTDDQDPQLFALEKYASINGHTPVSPNLKTWCGEEWERSEVMIFVGASGICVRTIAPYVKSKTTDPAVLVVDEAGSFVISLLSGHLGGANAWTATLAEQIGAVPVITTATDVEGKFAVDVWAKENGLSISSMKLAKEVSAAVLHGQKVLVCIPDQTIEGNVPAELTLVTKSEAESAAEQTESEVPVLILVSSEVPTLSYPKERILHMIPKDLVAGIGCRKGHPKETVQEMFREAVRETGIEPAGIARICSIDLKKEEEAILALSGELQVPFITYDAETLNGIEGEFTPSGFVSHITGVDNVCERSAAAGCEENYQMILRKRAKNGVTVAIAREARRIKF